MGEQFRCFCPAGNLAPNSISILVAPALSAVIDCAVVSLFLRVVVNPVFFIALPSLEGRWSRFLRAPGSSSIGVLKHSSVAPFRLRRKVHLLPMLQRLGYL
ncbi:hypothetical protein ACMYSQ_004436 [Aspergillus niger]